MQATITVLSGDGIGPEVTSQALAALLTVEECFHHDFTIYERTVGVDAILTEGVAISDETYQTCVGSDAILFGAIGSLPEEFTRPEGPRPAQALYRLRRGFDLYANIRPVRPLEAMRNASPLRPEVVSGTDIVFVRELSAGLYYGFAESTQVKPSEIRRRGNRVEAIDTLLYTEHEIERVARVAFDLAARRRGRLTSVDKANVLSSSVLWRRTLDRIAADHPEVELEHLLVDAFAVKLITSPTDFDVVVTENLFGDILTDEASVITGSIGMLPSASLGSARERDRQFGLYEPVHGAAPDIAGQDRANPLGAVLSAALLLRHSLGLADEARAVEAAVAAVVGDGYRTEDVREPDCTVVGTRRMGELVRDRLLHRGEGGAMSSVAPTDMVLEEQRRRVRAVRREVLRASHGDMAFSAEPPIRVLARLVRDLETTCVARGLNEHAIRREVANRTIGDVDVRRITECDGDIGGPRDFRMLADELGVALPGEHLHGHTASGETYRWLRAEMERAERHLLGHGYDPRVYDIDSVGNPVLRGWLAQDMRPWGLETSTEQVALGLGANDCIDKVFRGLAHLAELRGQERGAVLFPGPGFNMPEIQAVTFGLRLARVHTRAEDDFKLTPGLLTEQLDRHRDVRVVYLTVSNNPTAVAYTAHELTALQDVLRRVGEGRAVYVLADLAYIGTGVPKDDAARMRALTRDTESTRRMIYVNSYSKTFTMTGDRFGWVVFGDPALAVEMRSSWMNSVATLPAEWQLRFMACHRLFHDRPELLVKVRELYRLRRTRLRHRLHELDAEYDLFEHIYPGDDSTIYVWAHLRSGHDCYTVLEHTGIAGIPGSTFGYSDDYIRFSVGILPVPLDESSDPSRHGSSPLEPHNNRR